MYTFIPLDEADSEIILSLRCFVVKAKFKFLHITKFFDSNESTSFSYFKIRKLLGMTIFDNNH